MCVYELIKAEYVNGANVTRGSNQVLWKQHSGKPHKQKSSRILVSHKYRLLFLKRNTH